MKFMSEEERARRAGGFLGNVNSVLKPEAGKPDPKELGAASLNVLIKAALEIGLPLLDVYKTLGLHPAEGKAACDDLLARGLIALHRLPKGRGGQLVVIQVLPKGVEELSKRGIVPAERKLKRGGFLHAVYGEYLGKWASGHGLRHWWERTLGVKAFDFVYEQDGKLYGVEICLSGSVEWTAQQALKGASVEGIEELIVACERKPFLDAVMLEVKKSDELGLFRKKIVGKLLGVFVVNVVVLSEC